jgi:pimeloyl-ACP methyl ester carboxylesterase
LTRAEISDNIVEIETRSEGAMTAPEISIAARNADLLADEFAAVRREAVGLGAPEPHLRRTGHVLPDGRLLSAVLWGDEAPHTLFLHGGGLNAHSWDSLLVRLRLPALAVDLPGHGHSSWRDDFDYSPESMAEDLSALLVELARTSPIHVVGQSMGALVAAALADRHPDLIATLATIDITPSRRPSPIGSRPVRDFINGPSSFGSYEEVVDHALATGIGHDRASLERGVILNTRLRDDGRLVFRHHFGSPPPTARPGLEDISRLWNALGRVPGDRQMLVTGTRGIVEHDEVEEFLRRNPGAQHRELVAGHNVQRDAPDPLAALLREHLAPRA